MCLYKGDLAVDFPTFGLCYERASEGLEIEQYCTSHLPRLSTPYMASLCAPLRSVGLLRLLDRGSLLWRQFWRQVKTKLVRPDAAKNKKFP